MRHLKVLAILCAAWACLGNLAHAQVVVPTTLYSFCANNACQNGAFDYPQGAAGLVQATNGGLYGTTYGGGAYGYGSVFGVSPSGELLTLYSFCAESGCPDGSNPYFGVVPATDGNLYGITDFGGAYGAGTAFKISPGGTLTTLHSFCAESSCADGSSPYAGLVQASNGYLYGTTRAGGAHGSGTVFKMTLSGTLTTLYSFTGGSDGAIPAALLVQASNGDLYGTTYGGGSYGSGTIFKTSPGGTLTTLFNFNGGEQGGNGGASQNGLIQGADGYLWGTSKFAGAYSAGEIFKMTLSGTVTTVYTFSGSDGAWPNSTLVRATDGNLYGTTEISGSAGNGTIFKITPGGKLTTLYDFGSAYSGSGNSIYAGLFQATNGDFYGITEHGGSVGDGTIFGFSLHLDRFVETLPTSGRAGAAVIILGTNLENAISVSFNGAAAAFTVVSSSEIEATVPTGATSGPVKVTTPSGTLTGNAIFSVAASP